MTLALCIVVVVLVVEIAAFTGGVIYLRRRVRALEQRQAPAPAPTPEQFVIARDLARAYLASTPGREKLRRRLEDLRAKRAR